MWEKKIFNLPTSLTMRETCTISDLVKGGGSSSTWWLTMFVTCQLLVPSPTYFAIMYNLWGQQNLLFAICRFSPRLTLKYYMTLRGRENLLVAIRLMLKYYMTEQVNRVSDTKFMWLTTFVTCQLLVPSPTYFEIMYDLWGQQNLLLAICGFHPQLALKYYMTLWGKKIPLPIPPRKEKNCNIHESVLICFLFFFLVQFLPLPLAEAKYGDQQF